jgi:hypothetical protein
VVRSFPLIWSYSRKIRTQWKKWESRTRETSSRESERFFSHVPLLDKKSIEHMVMENDEFLSKYMGEDIMEE